MALTKVNLANTVEGVLPVANGGTGTSSGVAPGGSTTQVQYNNAGAFGGSSSFVFDGTNVGIGTTSTLGNSLLNVAQGVVARNASTTLPYFQTYNSNAGADLKTWRFGGNSSGALTFETVNDTYLSATERVRIAPTGEVGIGTNAPSGTLNVAGATNTSTNTLNLSGTGTGGNYAFIQNTTGRLAIGVESNSGSTIITGAGANEVSLSAKNTAINFSTNNGSTIAAKIDSSYMFYMNSGYGSAATAYGCRAWVNFAGSSGSINSSGGVSSVTRNGTGNYNVNFSFTMPDTSYAVTAIVGNSGGTYGRTCSVITDHNSARSTTTVNLNTYAYQQQANVDYASVQVSVFR